MFVETKIPESWKTGCLHSSWISHYLGQYSVELKDLFMSDKNTSHTIKKSI